MNKIKTRVAESSKRGVYLQDKELSKTIFKPGTYYRYVVDINNKIIILPSSNKTTNKVSKRQTKDGIIKPVIDIRSKEVKDAFKSADYLQVTIFEDQIIVKGFCKEEEKANIVNKTIDSVKKAFNKTEVIDITQILKVRKQAQIVLSKKELKKVSCLENQITFDEFFNVGHDLNSTSSVIQLKKSFENIKVPLTVVSLFSGAGILDKGFLDANFDIIFALEKDKDACLTYKSNIGDHVINSDITKYDKNTIPNATVIIGGPPCQGFSNANRVTNYLDNPNNLLVREYIDSVKANKDCKIFVIENVPRILTAGDGQFLNEIIDELSDFEISYGVVCSADMGSPQMRDRAIIIGSKLGKIDLPKPIVSKSNYATVREAFQGLNSQIPNQLDYSIPKAETLERIKHVPQGGNVFDIPIEIRPKGQHSDCYKRLEWDKPSITIVNPRKAMLLHPEEHRILSVRECARLFGVSDNFVFRGLLASMQQQIANAVPWHLSNAIAKVVKDAIGKYNAKICTV